MKHGFTRVVLFVVLSLMAAPVAFSQPAQTNTSLFAGLPWIETYNREVDLMHSLFNETNKNFDLKVYNSVKTNTNDSTVISFHLISCIFYYPTNIAHAPSATEMVSPDELACTKIGIQRRPNTNSIPANYVRVSDARSKDIYAEVEILLGVSPSEGPQEAKNFRRSFRFTYQSGWRENK